ncbi:MAG: hypothetical protein P1U87_23200, partial [Verrucomicrobiales bacterium]|nr:hypothetical protein [Verrucomicrobiales bacterium]
LSQGKRQVGFQQPDFRILWIKDRSGGGEDIPDQQASEKAFSQAYRVILVILILAKLSARISCKSVYFQETFLLIPAPKSFQHNQL